MANSIGLHSLPVNLEYFLVFRVKKVNRTIQICLVDDKWACPLRFELAWKYMELGIIQEDLIPLIDGFPGYELIMPLLLPILCNFGIEVGVVSQLF